MLAATACLDVLESLPEETLIIDCAPLDDLERTGFVPFVENFFNSLPAFDSLESFLSNATALLLAETRPEPRAARW